MPKTNFTKVEEVLEQGLRKYTADHLLELAGGAQPKPRNPTIDYSSNPSASQAQLSKAQTQLIAALQRDLKGLQKKGKALYSKLGIAKGDLKKMIDTPSALTAADWETIQQIREKIHQYRAELAKQLTAVSDEELVESERREHLTRRYNVNKKWLPLT